MVLYYYKGRAGGQIRLLCGYVRVIFTCTTAVQPLTSIIIISFRGIIATYDNLQ